MHKRVSKCTTHQTSNQKGNSNSRLHLVQLLWVKNRKVRIQFPWAHQNWPIEDWKNVSWFEHSDGRGTIKNMKAWTPGQRRIMRHVTKLKSSQTGFLTRSSLYWNSPHSHQISIQYSTLGIWWNGSFASWMCSRQICSNWCDAFMSISTKISVECFQPFAEFISQRVNVILPAYMFIALFLCPRKTDTGLNNVK